MGKMNRFLLPVGLDNPYHVTHFPCDALNERNKKQITSRRGRRKGKGRIGRQDEREPYAMAGAANVRTRLYV